MDEIQQQEHKIILEKLETFYKKPIVSIVFIGHVDAGKSTIGGQVLNLLGMIDQRTLEKYQKQASEKNRESWYLSWALDTDENERDKGKTAEVGRAVFELTNNRVILLDAPGHSMYVSDMICGANQADIAVLVVSARTSEFESGFEKEGQTREHVYLSRAGGIKKIVVLVNKMDEVDWNEERFLLIKNKIENFVRKVFSLEDIAFIPISGLKGSNILKRYECFYKGPTFLEYLDGIKIERKNDENFAFRVIDKIKMLGSNLFHGKIEIGEIKKSKVKILPVNTETDIVGIYDDEEVEIESGKSGDFVRIKLANDIEVGEGDVIMNYGCIHFISTDDFSCTLNILNVQNIISVGYKCVIHLGLHKKECKITKMAIMENKKLKKIQFAKKMGEKIVARIKIECPIVFTNLESFNGDMFVLRSENRTIALGVVRKLF